jgi:hypothetical protein
MVRFGFIARSELATRLKNRLSWEKWVLVSLEKNS